MAESPIAALAAKTFQEHQTVFECVLRECLPQIEAAADVICRALQDGKKILLCGNGGSAADAQHIAAELVGQYERKRRAWPAISLTTDTSALTAISNDHGYAQVFARQVEALAVRGDVLIAISTSGNSANVLAAVRQAKEAGCVTIALTGLGGGELARICDRAVVIPSDRTARVQEAHITIGHLWCEIVDGMESGQD
ncbi:MAG: D-sedoheptulose 7-phosphate isomerase [Blastocatellia bacterium]|jgi:D-sedoheptulose 7-phosphate isomerase|nr:D-sedoheptulose 7-phosphate isomerase [Blastocatellia bacterium]